MKRILDNSICSFQMMQLHVVCFDTLKKYIDITYINIKCINIFFAVHFFCSQ